MAGYFENGAKDPITANLNQIAAARITPPAMPANQPSAPIPAEQQVRPLDMLKQQIQAGDPNANMLHKRVRSFVGNDQMAQDAALQHLIDHPDEIDPSNSYQVNTALAQWSKSSGYNQQYINQQRAPRQMPSIEQIAMEDLANVAAGRGSNFFGLQREAEQHAANLAESDANLLQKLSPSPEGRRTEFERLSALAEDPSLSDQERTLVRQRLETIARGGMNPLDRKLYTVDSSGNIVPKQGLLETEQTLATGGKFAEGLGTKTSEQLMEKRSVAFDAEETLEANSVAREILDKGVITGFGADFLTNMGRALNQAGINLAQDPVENTQAFMAMRAQQVGRIIKLFGSGTGLSDADRTYAEKAAAGQVTMDEGAIRKIMDIADRQARWSINRYNRELKKAPTAAQPYDLSISGGSPAPRENNLEDPLGIR